MRSRLRQRQRGFGLIELLASLAVLAVLALAALPKMWSLSDEWRVRNEALKFAACLEYYRELSMARAGAVWAFRRAGLRMEPLLELTATGYAVRADQTTEEYLVPRYALPANITVTHNGAPLRFDAAGNAGLTNTTFTFKCNAATQYVIVDTVGRVRTSDLPAT